MEVKDGPLELRLNSTNDISVETEMSTFQEITNCGYSELI
jgi:hypothetical protein